MRSNSSLIVAAYLMAAGLILAPLAETLISVWPLQPGTVSWRFGTAGLISRGLLTSLMGLLLAGTVAFVSGHRRILLTLSALCGMASLALLAGLSLMVLDAVQFRASVNPEARTGYDMAAASAIVRYVHALAVTALLALGGWSAARIRGSQGSGEKPRSKLALRPSSSLGGGREEE